MEHKLRCLMPHSTLQHVMRLLKDTKHNAFPVVTPDNPTAQIEESEMVDKLPTTLAAQNIRYRVRTSALLNNLIENYTSLSDHHPF